MRLPVTAYIGLGANLGDAQGAVREAVQAIAALDGVALKRQSSLYTSAPVDSSGPDYVNAVVEVQTRHKAQRLLRELQAIEARAGRRRPYRNAPRTLDLDLLLYAQVHINSPHLTLPHPRMLQRAFVLVPLAEIAPARVGAQQLQSVLGQALARIH